MRPRATTPHSAALAARRRARAQACRDPELRRVLMHPATVPAAATPERAAAATAAGAAGGARLLSRQLVTGDLLRLQVTRPPGFSYLPGQYVKLGVPGISRKYSLVSAPHEPTLEFFVRLFPGGQLSERLRTLASGAELVLSGPARGKLRLDSSRPNQLLVATVTGIAPYVSLLRHALAQPTRGPRFIVLHGARHADEFGYREELEALAARHPRRLTYVPTVSQPGGLRSRGWRGATGRVDALAEAAPARYRLSPADTAVFACGNPDMVRQLGAAFRRLGYATSTEAFT